MAKGTSLLSCVGTASGGGPDRHVDSGDDQNFSWSRPYWHAPNLDFWGGKHPTGGRAFHPGVSYLAVPLQVMRASKV